MRDFLAELNDKVLLFDGGMGSELYKRGVFFNNNFEALNLSSPDTVKEIHLEYIQSGVDVIETNTYGANRIKLEKFGLSDLTYQINYEGAKLAKQCAGEEIFVAGSIGPVGYDGISLGQNVVSKISKAFHEQISGLVDGNVDLLIFETFIAFEELKLAVQIARSKTDIPIIAEFTINDDCSSLKGDPTEVLLKELVQTGADVIGINCTAGPKTMLEFLKRTRNQTKLPLVVMPNAGKPKNIDGRNMYVSTPEYFSEYTRHFINAGANIVGGCCGVGPKHIKKMRSAILSLKPKQTIALGKDLAEQNICKCSLIKPEDKSRLASRLALNKFVKTVEIVSPHGLNPQEEIDKARMLFYKGVDAVNIPDGPRAGSRMSALSLCALIKEEVGIEPILHCVCRDRNIIGLQSDLLGAYALGIRNILALTGDPPKLGKYPDATGVFDIDSIGLTKLITGLNHQYDISGKDIKEPGGFFVGVGANPYAVNIDEELRRLELKIKAGAEYIITQPVYDEKAFESFLKIVAEFKKPLIAGFWPLSSIRNIDFLNNEVPGCFVPKYIRDAFVEVSDNKDASRELGIKIANETINKYKNDIQGVQVSLPFGKVEAIRDLLDGLD